MQDYPKFFRCFTCTDYKPVEDIHVIQIKGFLLPKDVCSVCLEKIKKGLPISSEDPKKKLEEKPAGEKA
jgi:hypothetical protein